VIDLSPQAGRGCSEVAVRASIRLEAHQLEIALAAMLTISATRAVL
jgi:hypothetical protein